MNNNLFEAFKTISMKHSWKRMRSLPVSVNVSMTVPKFFMKQVPFPSCRPASRTKFMQELTDFICSPNLFRHCASELYH